MHDMDKSLRSRESPAVAKCRCSTKRRRSSPVAAGLAADDDTAPDRVRTTVLGKVRTFERGAQPRLPLHTRYASLAPNDRAHCMKEISLPSPYVLHRACTHAS